MDFPKYRIKIQKMNSDKMKALKKNQIKALFAFSIMTPLLLSCEMEASGNGKLDGFWHLEAVDTLATGNTCDYRERKIFWAVEYKLVAVRNFASDATSDGYYFRFSQSSDSLILFSPYANHWHQDNGEEGGDIPMTEVNVEMKDMGVNHLEEHYHKDALSGSKMVLSNKEYRLRFTKF